MTHIISTSLKELYLDTHGWYKVNINTQDLWFKHDVQYTNPAGNGLNTDDAFNLIYKPNTYNSNGEPTYGLKPW